MLTEKWAVLYVYLGMVSNELYTKSKSKNIPMHHVCEVGVYSPELSNILDFITRDHIRTTLVEPMPDSIASIGKVFGKYPHVRLFPVAIYDHHGTLELAQRGESTFATTLPFSPARRAPAVIAGFSQPRWVPWHPMGKGLSPLRYSPR